MYEAINNHIEVLIDGICRDAHVQPYIDICKLFSERKSSSEQFKAKYRAFYQLNAARLSEEFCTRYFEILELKRNDENIDPLDIVNTLYVIPCNSKGKKAIHFSFATKLAHTVNRNRPIYDSMVAGFYFLPEIKTGWDKDRKLTECKRQYTFLKEEYERILANDLLAESIAAFRKRFQPGKSYSEVKVIDTLIWRYTAYLKAGAVRDGRVRYG